VQPTDTISDIKLLLASQAGAPPADVQRLLLKGKSLADAKLLKEYSVKDGDTINLMVKPSFEWNPSSLPWPAASPTTPSLVPESSLAPESKQSRSHQRIPSVILSPSPNSSIPLGEGKPVDIPLTLDSTTIGSPSQNGIPVSSYQITVSQPEFWKRLLAFLLFVVNLVVFTCILTRKLPQKTIHVRR
jgi:UV excision repair protein RAD23